MTIIHHPQHLADRAVMLVFRGMLALQPALEFTPDARPAFDELMRKTPAVDGVACERATINGVPGWWCRPADTREETALLHFHGGAYVLGSAEAYVHFVSQIAVRAKANAFVADYRLAPEHPYPAAVDDALAVFRGIAASGIRALALSGDSAGGGLALVTLVRACNEARQGGLRPACAAVMSPWCDLTLSGESMVSKEDSDPLLSRASLEQAARAYAGGQDRAGEQLSPWLGNLAGLPPIVIHVGEDEVLLDDSRRFERRCAEAGTLVELHAWEGMTHVFPSALSTLTAAREAMNHIGSFLENQLRSAAP